MQKPAQNGRPVRGHSPTNARRQSSKVGDALPVPAQSKAAVNSSPSDFVDMVTG
jgi:hypothetical protein